MEKFYIGAFTLCTVLGISAQEAYLLTIKTDINKTVNAKLIKR